MRIIAAFFCLLFLATQLGEVQLASADTGLKPKEILATGPHLPNGLDRKEINDQNVLRAMSFINRKDFVPHPLKIVSKADRPLPIGEGQTISQPFIVAYMSQEARIKPGDKVLEIGTGSGYQAAVLAKLGAKVFTIEIVEPLGKKAEELFKKLGYDSIQVRIGDGFAGWEEEAPFSAIVVTAAAPRIPEILYQQLAVGGRMVLPLKDSRGTEWMTIVTKQENLEPLVEKKFAVRFVPMTGEIQKTRKE